MVGLSHGDTDQGFADIDFAFYLTSVGTVIIYEAGVCRGESAATSQAIPSGCST